MVALEKFTEPKEQIKTQQPLQIIDVVKQIEDLKKELDDLYGRLFNSFKENKKEKIHEPIYVAPSPVVRLNDAGSVLSNISENVFDELPEEGDVFNDFTAEAQRHADEIIEEIRR